MTARVRKIIENVNKDVYGTYTCKLDIYEMKELSEAGYMYVATVGGKYNVSKLESEN